MQSHHPIRSIELHGSARRLLSSLALVIACTSVPVPGDASNAGMKGPPNQPAVTRQAEKTHPDITGRVFLSPIRFFQRHISPIDGPRCQFSPTCSSYGHQVVSQQGPLLGILITADRLMRCNYGTSSSDYVRLPNGRLSDPLSDNLLEE